MSLINLDQEQLTITANIGGNFTLLNGATYSLHRIGDIVFFYCKMNQGPQTGSFASAILISGLIPERFRPILAINQSIFVSNNGVGVSGDFTVSSNGNIAIYVGYSGGFGTTTGNAFFPINASWTIR